jgi:homoaconitase/3-isopropylmalate dehydratase large subunit
MEDAVEEGLVSIMLKAGAMVGVPCCGPCGGYCMGAVAMKKCVLQQGVENL